MAYIYRHAHCEDMEHAVMDATAMDVLPEGCFDLVIDKALLDCLMCAENDPRALISRLIQQVRLTAG